MLVFLPDELTFNRSCWLFMLMFGPTCMFIVVSFVHGILDIGIFLTIALYFIIKWTNDS